MADHYQSIRLQRVEEPKIRLRVMPRVPPLEIELQNTGTEIQWRLGTTGDWATLLELGDIDASVSIGSVTTLPAGDPATVTNSGTAQDVVLDFGIPAGADGADGTNGADGADGLIVSIVAGLGISVDSTDPGNPIVTAAVQSVAGLTGSVAAAALKTALAIAVADITDASANGRSLISAANYAAMKTLLSLNNVDNTSDSTKNSATATLTNKRVTPRVFSEASNATPTPAGDSYDQHNITALAAAAAFAAPTGTPTAAQKLTIRIKDNGTARALTWNAIYRAMGTALPTTTVLSKTLYLGFIYNSTDTKWDLVASAQEA